MSKEIQIEVDNIDDIQHNEEEFTEVFNKPELINFYSRPKKEIDVTSITFGSPQIKILVSCKNHKRNVQQDHVQEWGNVISVLNQSAIETTYFGLIVSASGFASGCEAWASVNNVGLIPPIKGVNSLSFTYDEILAMYRRVIASFSKLINFEYDYLTTKNNFYNFVYEITSPIEGYKDFTISASNVLKIIDDETGYQESSSKLFEFLIGRSLKSIHRNSQCLLLFFNDEKAAKICSTQVDYNINSRNIDFQNFKEEVYCIDIFKNDFISDSDVINNFFNKVH